MEGKVADNGGGPDRPARNVGSRKRARGFPKGRQLDVEALREVRKQRHDWRESTATRSG